MPRADRFALWSVHGLNIEFATVTMEFVRRAAVETQVQKHVNHKVWKTIDRSRSMATKNGAIVAMRGSAEH